MEAPPERRGSRRHRFDPASSNPAQATIGLIPRAALACDLSPTGVGVLTTDAPPVGAVVPIWLASEPGTTPCLVLTRVANTQAVSPGLFRVGLTGADEGEAAVLAEAYRRSAPAFSARSGGPGGTDR